MTAHVLAAKPGPLIRRAQQIHIALFAEECGAFDLTSVQYGALAAIREAPGIDATRLSLVIGFDRSTLGDVLERLEHKGWLRRVPSAADKRVKLLHLTPAGAALLREVDPHAGHVQDRLLGPLDPADRAALLRLLERLVDLHTSEARASHPIQPTETPHART